MGGTQLFKIECIVIHTRRRSCHQLRQYFKVIVSCLYTTLTLWPILRNNIRCKIACYVKREGIFFCMKTAPQRPATTTKTLRSSHYTLTRIQLSNNSKYKVETQTRRSQRRNFNPSRIDIHKHTKVKGWKVTSHSWLTNRGREDSLFNHEEWILQSHLRTLIQTGRRPAGAHALSKRGAAADSPRPIKQVAAYRQSLSAEAERWRARQVSNGGRLHRPQCGSLRKIDTRRGRSRRAPLGLQLLHWGFRADFQAFPAFFQTPFVGCVSDKRGTNLKFVDVFDRWENQRKSNPN